ncbi:hypothetical protein HYV86_07555 [Candidatus Woesearchaeota archaeon]|nr:hypothetical protein [Candidatus Woesearchaeota archaeon]
MGRIKHALIRNLPFSMVHKQLQKQGKDYEAFKAQFLDLEPEFVETLQERYLIHSFQLNAQRIPHYKHFLEKHNFDPRSVKTKQDFLTKVPETNKHGYVYSAKELSTMCIDGDYHNISMIVKSSGHSGRQCYWAKSHAEDDFGKNAISVGLDLNFNVNTKKTLIINGFILGSWVTGLNFNEFASRHNPVINIGPDKDEILQTINDIGSKFEQILITGYPPFIKDFVDYANSLKFNWKKYKVHFIGGGEDFPESWRAYIHKNAGGAKVRSGFGASDIGILGGTENDDTVFIRQLADANHEFRRAIFGDVDETPMLFQYPLNLFVFANKDRELVFTTILPEAAQPVIKYNLEDIGGTYSYRQMEKLLKQFNINHTITLPLPFFFIEGRKDGPLKFNAFMIYPENIEECIYRNKQIAQTTSGAFVFTTKFDAKHNRQLHIEFQLKKGVNVSTALTKTYETLVMKTLQEVNEGYKATCHKMAHLATPVITLYRFDDYPHQSKIKNRYHG